MELPEEVFEYLEKMKVGNEAVSYTKRRPNDSALEDPVMKMLLRQWLGKQMRSVEGGLEYYGLYFPDDLRACKANPINFEKLITQTEEKIASQGITRFQDKLRMAIFLLGMAAAVEMKSGLYENALRMRCLLIFRRVLDDWEIMHLDSVAIEMIVAGLGDIKAREIFPELVGLFD